MNQYTVRPSIFSRFSDIPLPLLLCFYLIQNCYIMRPWNLCRHRLHKFPIRIGRRKFCHILEISHRIPFCFRECQPNVCSKVFNKFISPGFMLVDGWPNIVVQTYQFPVDIQRCPILRTLDFLLDILYQIQVLATVHQHLQILHSHEMKHTFFSGYFTIQRKRKQLAFNSTNEKAIQTCRVVHNDNHSWAEVRLFRTVSW